MPTGDLLLDFSNVGTPSSLRRFPGLPLRSAQDKRRLAPRGCLRFTVKTGQLLRFSGSAVSVNLLVLNTQGGNGLDALGLKPACTVSRLSFDAEELFHWAAAKDLDPSDMRTAQVPVSAAPFLKATQDCTVWAILAATAADLVSGTASGDVEIQIDRAGHPAPLPDPLGKVIDEFTIPRGTASAYELAAGQFVQVIDVEGQQCSDFMAFGTRGLDAGTERMIDNTATRSMVRRAYPMPGLLDKFFDRDMRPMLQVVQDTCGRHDTFGLACTARGYEDRGFPGHLNCSDNISAAMAPFGVERRAAWPAINFFWNTWVDPHSHHILTEESHSRPGDYVVMRALSDLVCVSTACPDDIDPINGWNPTDVHVRIYAPETPIARAVGFRAKEDSAMTISHESAFHERTSALTQDFVAARNLWVPASFPSTGTLGEYWACRDNVTLQDMSSLRKYDIVGPDAERLLQHLLTRDISRLAQWRATYALMCDETGSVVDDGTLLRLGPQLFRWCCGSEESARRIEAVARSEGMQARLSDASDTLVNLALQGPKSRDVLTKMVFTQPHVPALEHIKWFGVTVGRLHDREGTSFVLSRTGYTGELGYELFCAKPDAIAVWDSLMAHGEAFGIAPMGTAALEVIRIEAGLAAPGAEFRAGIDAFDAGLGFAVDLKKAAFVGRDALQRNAEAPRTRLKGLAMEGDDVPLAGAAIFAGERQIGEVTSATRSPLLGHGIAMARLAIEFSETGCMLDVGMMDGHMKRLPARVVDIPFIDPKRERARA
ncbi:MAG: DUF1989 domain-containing protein [Pseudomonadota bacterium]